MQPTLQSVAIAIGVALVATACEQKGASRGTPDVDVRGDTSAADDTGQDPGDGYDVPESLDGGSDPETGGSPSSPDWETEVHPYLVEACGTCHLANPPITPYVGPGAFGDPDPATAHAAALLQVVPGQPDKSRLFIKVSQDTPVTGGMRMPMPPVPPMDEAKMTMLSDWIAAGAPGGASE